MILDKVANCCLEAETHYIDLGGYDILLDKLKGIDSKVKEKGLLFLISSGWIPGISGILPIHVADYAENSGIKIKELNVYTTGKEKWSYGSCRDMVWSMFENFYGVYKNGEWKKKSVLFSMKKIFFDSIKEKQQVMVMFNNQLAGFAKKKSYPLLAEYIGSNEFGFRSKLVSLYIQIFMKNNKDKAASLFQKSLENDQRKGGKRFGLVQVEVCGSKKEKVVAEMYTDNNYFLTGVAPAIAARQIINNEVINKSGVHYMCNVIDTKKFLERLKELNHSISYSHE